MSGRLRFHVGRRPLAAATRLSTATRLFTAIALCLTAAAIAPEAAAATSRHDAAGPGAGCAVATPGQAGAAQPGAPTAVHAIAGNGSVTVTWCAPAQGQGQVVSYTVTSSTGQQTTADVPNHYVIATGLTNGNQYSFTVVANTASGPSGPVSSPSNQVIPDPISGPRDVLRGTPESVAYDQYSLMIGGKRTFIYAGEFDPWRLPSPSLWLDRLEKMKADGYNAVTPYFDWDYQSPAPGVYDFSGVRDVNEFLNMAQQAGLYVIARPGPYINAETDGGGFPGWLVTGSGTARTDAPDFVAASDQWLSEIDPIIAAHQITRGGDVILYQVENELFNSETATNDYMAELEAKAKADGINVPLTGNSSDTFQGTNGNPQIPGYDSYPLGFNCADTSGFGNPPTFSAEPGVPLMLPEFQGGSYDSWGGSAYPNCYALTGTDFENVFYKSNLADGVTIQSNYMGVGGTNWGWLPAPFMYTSYDYGAAIQETGEIGTPSNSNTIPNSKYGENKLIGDFIQATPSLTKTVPVTAPALDNSAVTATARANPDDGTQFIYLRQADASSTATVSTHMALNADESGTYTYDDTAPPLDYTGNWSHVSNQSYTGGDYEKTESFSDTTGDSMSVTFTGTAVQWIAPDASNHGIADVFLDGNQVATVDGYSPGSEFQQVLYSVSGLADTSHTLKIVVSGQKNPASGGTYVSIDAINVPTAAQAADYYPVVPQAAGTAITLQGRDAKLLLANDAFAGQQLVYSTSELMTQAQIGSQAVALLYGPAGTDGETVLRYTSQPTVKVLSGNVTSRWDASRGDLRLDYVHNGLARVQITGGGRPSLLLLLAQKTVAEEFWPESTSAGPVLVRGTYLIRSAVATGSRLALTGDTSRPATLTVWAPPQISAVTWDGRPVATTAHRNGSLAGRVGGPAPVTLPALGHWRFSFETPEAQPGYDDSTWMLADHPVTTNPTKPVTTPVLYADDYGFHTGFVWYRGHFTATGNETGIDLTAGGGTHGAFSVWLNGAFLGSDTAGGDQTQMTFPFPAAALRPGRDNVVAVVTQSSGHDEDGVYGPPPSDAQKAPRGLLGASLQGASTAITWRLQGSQGGESLQDPVRGPMNATGLFGTNRGWDLPGYPDHGWQPVSLPDSWSGRGLPPGIGWYRTTFDLGLPRQSYVPVALQIGGAASGPGTTGADYRAFVFVNGWLIGQYDNTLGPQHQFYVPAGILDQDGRNTLAIAVWGLDPTGGGLDRVKLVATGDQSGGVPVQTVYSPGWNPFVYGPPTAPSPTLGVTSSSSLVNPGQASTVKATLNNPGDTSLRDSAISLSVPSGWTVTPSGADSLGTVSPGSTVSAKFKVTAPASGTSAPGPVDLVARATYDALGQPQSLLATAQLQVPFGSLAASFDNTAVTDDSNRNPSANFEGFDGEGTTYSAQGLASAGLAPGSAVSADGLSFTWPNGAPAQPDNTMAEGQIIRVSGSGAKLGFLTAANNSAESGSGTVYYTDGSTSTFTLDVGNFWYPPGQSGNPANNQVASVNYANYPTGSSGHTIYVFEQSVPIDSSKTVEAVALPPLGDVQGYNPAVHIFAIDVGG
ncbi:MAG TPA: beta-galactosidase [Solirubrobacteraceae bacterium]